MNGITVAPLIPGLLIIEEAVWKIKADGRIVNRVTGEVHPDQIREREAEKPKVWTAGGRRWTINEAGQVCYADRGLQVRWRISIAGFGISSAACFNSASAARAVTHCFRTGLVSSSVTGGRQGRSL